MVLNYGGSWTLYTVGYGYQIFDVPLSATHLEFSRDDGQLWYTLERGDAIVSAGVVYEDRLSNALGDYYRKG